jgi:nucleoside-diphosphate-sugar epimerase
MINKLSKFNYEYLTSKVYFEDLVKVSTEINNWKYLKNKKVLITGASGLIGSFIVDLLMYRNTYFNDNIFITSLVRNKHYAKQRFKTYLKSSHFNLEIKDISKSKPKSFKYDYIIHGASNTHPKAYSTDPIGTINTNIFGTKNLLDFCVSYNVSKFVFLSSVEIYGENKGDVNLFKEDYLGYIDSNTTRSGYPESKRLAESLCNAYKDVYGLNFVIARLSRVFGPNILNSDTKVMSQFIGDAFSKKNIVLKSLGNQVFSYLYVSDAVKGIIKILLDGQNGQAYNIGDDNPSKKLIEIANFLAELNNLKIIYKKPKLQEKKGYSVASKAVLDVSKIKKLNWTQTYTIFDGIKRTLKILEEMRK